MAKEQKAATAADENNTMIPPVEPKGETVTVDKAKLDELLTKSEEQQKTIDMLLATADKSRIARYQELEGTPIAHEIKLRTFKGKIVVGWRSVSDEMYQDANGRWFERQIVEIITEDGEAVQMPYLESEKLTKIMATITGTSEKKIDDVVRKIFTVQTKEGKTLEIDSTYVN